MSEENTIKTLLKNDLSDDNYDCHWDCIFKANRHNQVSRVLRFDTTRETVEFQLYKINGLYVLLDSKKVSLDEESIYDAIDRALFGKCIKGIMAQIYEDYSTRDDSYYMFKVARWLNCYDRKE
jgi:hypothetical protein